MNEERIIELEIKLAYQEDLLQALNATVSLQQQQMTRLENSCKLLNDKVKNLIYATESVEHEQQRPPHY
jgi:SlyX protein